MGVVYAAHDIHLGRAVAVKVAGARVDAATGQGRLVREAQAMAKLRFLAQVRRVLARSELSLLDLDTGERRRIDVPGTSLDFPRWQPDGSLLAVRSSGGERGIVRIQDDNTVELVASVPADDEPLTTAGEFQVSGDGNTAAILMTDSLQTHWWIPTLQD
jgi:hypothetical protein